MAKKKKKKKSNVVLNIIIALVFLAGAGVFLYPTISDMWNQYRNAQLVSKYEEAVTELSDNDYDRLWKEAKEYNAEHPVNAIVDAFEEEDTYELSHPYDRVLDPNGDGLMGSIEIPKIKAKLAIYHGLSKTVLEKGGRDVCFITADLVDSEGHTNRFAVKRIQAVLEGGGGGLVSHLLTALTNQLVKRRHIFPPFFSYSINIIFNGLSQDIPRKKQSFSDSQLR